MGMRLRYVSTVVAVASAGWSMPGFAGCHLQNVANFQVGQSAFVQVSNDDPAGKVLRSNVAFGEGVELLRCDAGLVAFRGRWSPEAGGDLRMLTVGGKEAGVAVKLALSEQDVGPERAFPFQFTRAMLQDETIRSTADVLRYEIVRATGPVVYGPVDATPVAYTDAEDGKGGWARFRTMNVYEMTLQRPACALEPEDMNQRVELPAYSVSNFDAVERATPWSPFFLRVLACSDPQGLIARMRFGVPGDAEPGHPEWFSLPPGAPPNVALELGGDGKAPMRPGAPIDLPALGTGGRYEFAVRLRETRPSAGAGRFSRPVRVEVEYL
jgi:type 1 fimbria pilin